MSDLNVVSQPGFYLPEMSPGAILEVETKRHIYTLVNLSGGKVAISGHPQYCPQPVEVRITGSRPGFIGPGMRLEFWHPSHALIATSGVRQVRRIQ